MTCVFSPFVQTQLFQKKKINTLSQTETQPFERSTHTVTLVLLVLFLFRFFIRCFPVPTQTVWLLLFFFFHNGIFSGYFLLLSCASTHLVSFFLYYYWSLLCRFIAVSSPSCFTKVVLCVLFRRLLFFFPFLCATSNASFLVTYLMWSWWRSIFQCLFLSCRVSLSVSVAMTPVSFSLSPYVGFHYSLYNVCVCAFLMPSSFVSCFLSTLNTQC